MQFDKALQRPAAQQRHIAGKDQNIPAEVLQKRPGLHHRVGGSQLFALLGKLQRRIGGNVGKILPHALPLVADNQDHRPGAAAEGAVDHMSHHRPPPDGEHHLCPLRVVHAGPLAGRHDHDRKSGIRPGIGRTERRGRIRHR